ncbi:MAG: acylphosphatase, partial [Chlamydiae bacterium]|nr:acylphosphatase [Chlamydiota bacterium]
MSVEIRIRVVFYGKVQGVGFRRQVKLKADALHIKGFIRNCQSGSVESVLIGPASSIDLLLK